MGLFDGCCLPEDAKHGNRIPLPGFASNQLLAILIEVSFLTQEVFGRKCGSVFVDLFLNIKAGNSRVV
jgi:hypothetical protein